MWMTAITTYKVRGIFTCSIEMPKNKHTGQLKGFTFLNVPAYVRDEIIKLDGIEYKN